MVRVHFGILSHGQPVEVCTTFRVPEQQQAHRDVVIKSAVNNCFFALNELKETLPAQLRAGVQY